MQRLKLMNPEASFFCPMNGEPIYTPDCFEPSDATVFVYNSMVGQIESLSDETDSLLDRITEQEKDASADVLFEKLCGELANRDDLLLVSLDVDQGPGSYSVHFCIDLMYKELEEDEWDEDGDEEEGEETEGSEGA